MFLSPFRLYCPRNCLEENPHISRVIGTRIYSDVSCFRLTTDVEIELNELTFFFLHNLSSCILLQKSSICRAAVHAGVFRNDVGGYIDVMPVDKRKHYIASYQNGIFSERYGMLYTVVRVCNAWVNCSPKTSHFSSPKPECKNKTPEVSSLLSWYYLFREITDSMTAFCFTTWFESEGVNLLGLREEEWEINGSQVERNLSTLPSHVDLIFSRCRQFVASLMQCTREGD